MPPPTILPQHRTADKEFQGLLSDPEIRRQLRKTLKGFGLLYFSHHLYLPPGDFHDEMIAALGNEADEFLEIIGFRGSSKTTWGSLIAPIFLALERNEDYGFIILAAETSLQAGLNIAAIKHELETNDLLLQDYGKFEVRTTDDPVPEPSLESEEEWQAKNMLLSNGVRILARSRGQKIRGLKARHPHQQPPHGRPGRAHQGQEDVQSPRIRPRQRAGRLEDLHMEGAVSGPESDQRRA